MSLSVLNVPTEYLVVGAAVVTLGVILGLRYYLSETVTYPFSQYGVASRAQLVAVLSSDNGAEFALKLIESKPGQKRETVAECLAIVLPDRHRLVVVSRIIKAEVEAAESESILFRANALASKTMTKISQQVGQKYLKELLTDFVAELERRNEEMDVFPARTEEGLIRRNADSVLHAFEEFFERFVQSLDNLPWQISWMASELHCQATVRFPNSAQSVVGGFILLRFICPALVRPDHLTGSTPSQKVSRGLVTLAKILQNLSNNLKWNHKEEYMTIFNHIIDDYRPAWNEKVLAVLSQDFPMPQNVPGSAQPVTATQYDDLEKIFSG